MRASIACALLAASCSGKGGVEIVVKGETAQVKQVHLFIGVGDAYTEAINTKNRAFPFPKSTAFGRDAYNDLDVRDVVADQPVVFQFQGDAKLGVVIAVGVDGDTPISAGVLHAIEVPSDYIARYEITLEPIATQATPSPLELDVWQPQVGSPKEGKVCVALFDQRTTAADAVVTDGDPDCDGWPTGDPKECQPNLYLSYKRPTLDDAQCVLPEMTPQNTVAGCVLGGPACADGHGRETSCNAPTPYCVPLSVCNQCGNDWNCARDLSSGSATFTHIQCKLFVDIYGKVCANTLKAFAQPPMNIGGHFCKTDSANPALITSVGHDWSPTITYDRLGTLLKIDVKNVEPNCNFEIVPYGALGTTAMNRVVFGGMVAGMLDNGRGVAVPITFELDPTFVGCDNAPPYCAATWSWNLAELVDTCVNTPVFPP